MSIRYRLFLWVGGLLLGAALLAFALEFYVTRTSLNKARKDFETNLWILGELKQKNLQQFLTVSLEQTQGMINGLLQHLSALQFENERFAPTLSNAQTGTTLEGVDLLLSNSWIDLLQNTNAGTLSSAILATTKPLHPLARIDIDHDLCWIFQGATPYLGIRVPYVQTPSNSRMTQQGEVLEILPGSVLEGYFMIPYPATVTPAPSEPPFLPIPWTDNAHLQLTTLTQRLEHLRTLHLSPPAAPVAAKDTNPLYAFLDGDLQRVEMQMLWILASVREAGTFGSFPLDRLGLALFTQNSAQGWGFWGPELLSTSPFFDDASYFQSHPPQIATSNLAQGLAVIPHADSNQFFLANTAQLKVKLQDTERVGYLTLGIDGTILLKTLALATQQTGLFLYEDRVLSAYSPSGDALDPSEFDTLPFPQLLSKPWGTVTVGSTATLYMHLSPASHPELHLLLLDTQQQQFTLIHSLEDAIQKLIISLFTDVHVIGFVVLIAVLFILQMLSKKMTAPIRHLARAAEEISTGKLATVQLPTIKKDHHDEISELYSSFESMIHGLQETERVKGVLNKVVSPEIASEILKNEIHLGGEKKEVTVLFADIRGFTALTQHMSPQAIIRLLNECMTRLSEVIDHHGGVIDKFVGDEVMALFGAPLSCPDASLKAILTALEMNKALNQWNTQRALESLPPIEVGIGIHKGEVLAGNMGAENRLNYTVIGSHVNLAARLCALAKRQEIVITEQVLKAPDVTGRIAYEPLPPTTIKGFDEQISLYKVLHVL